MNSKLQIGKDHLDNVFTYDFKTNPHLLISGYPRPGIIDLLHSIISQLTKDNTPDEIKIVIIDVHRIEFGDYETSQFLMRPLIRDLETLPQIFSEIVESKDILVPTFIVIEELSDIMRLHPKVMENLLSKIIQIENIHLVIGIQRPSIIVLTDKMIKNIPNIITFHQNNKPESERLLDNPNALNLECNGEFIYRDTAKQVTLRLI